MSQIVPPAPSAYQQAIHHTFKTTTSNMLIQACAGSGKTTVLSQLCQFTSAHDRVVALAFNKEIANEFKNRLPPHVLSSTMHSLGLKILRGSIPRVTIDEHKMDNIVRHLIRAFSKETQAIITDEVKWLHTMGYATMTDLDDDAAVDQLVKAFGGVITADPSVKVAAEAMRLCREKQDLVGFDDMIDHPLFHDYKAIRFKLILVDESQDLNLQQIAFLRYISADDARIIAVGDRFQSIYQWRGADTKAMDRIQREFDCVEMPLSISYRCPRKVVDLARQITPTIEVNPGAIEGELDMRTSADYDALLDELQPGTMVLCRTNAPLMPVAMSLIRRGTKAIIKGRDIGKGLVALVERIETKLQKDRGIALVPKDLFVSHLLDDTRKRVRKAFGQEKLKSALYMIDQYETIIAASGDAFTVTELKATIERIFSDGSNGVILSSVHRSKGLEADEIVILGPEMMPHPMAYYSPNLEEALQQEANIKYVAITRAKKKLTYQPLKDGMIGSSKDSIMRFLGETRLVSQDTQAVLDAVADSADGNHQDILPNQLEIETITGKIIHQDERQ